MSEIESQITRIPEDGKFQISDNLTLNIFSGELRNTSSNMAIDLKGKQLGLFLLLSSRAGEVVTYKSITDHVYGDHNAVDIDKRDKERIWTMTVLVNDKLKRLGTGFTIINHKKEGYSFSREPVKD